MWFITSGINGGISQMVGDALSEEMVYIIGPFNCVLDRFYFDI